MQSAARMLTVFPVRGFTGFTGPLAKLEETSASRAVHFTYASPYPHGLDPKKPKPGENLEKALTFAPLKELSHIHAWHKQGAPRVG